MDTFRKRIKKIRGECTYQAFADSLSIAKSALQKYENGTGKPSFEVLLKIIEVYGVDPAWLMTGKASEGGKEGAGSSLTAEEKQHIGKYRLASAHARRASDCLLEHFDFTVGYQNLLAIEKKQVDNAQ